jgi:hypothetical protein
MPQENELKYIVRWDIALEAKLKFCHDCVYIEQAYLNDRARLRRKISEGHDESFVFTYKQRLSHGRNIEIETPISEQDYRGLLSFSTERLTKNRITIQHSNIRWDIDFPCWKHGNHFIIAEAEMADTMEQPERMLEVLEPYVVFAVPRTDRRFTARRLSDEKVAIALATELGLR